MTSPVDYEDPFGDAESETSEEKPKVKKPVKHSETARARSSSSMAQGGRMVGVEDYPELSFPAWGDNYDDLMDYEPSAEIDISDVSAVSRELMRARRRLFTVQKALTEAQRVAAETKFVHRRARNRYLIGLSGGTDRSREAMADVATEEEYGAMIVADQIAQDLLGQQRAVKAELDSLANLSHNIRAQMSIQ